MTPEVSVLIPVFNSASFLEKTIGSVINQTFKNFEIIVVDDGSIDNSREIIQKLEKQHDVIISHFQSNQGACKARNSAFELSCGKYIQYLDADDILHPNKIEDQVKMARIYDNSTVISGQWDRFNIDLNEAKFPQRFVDKDYANPIDWLIDSWEGKGMAQTAAWLTPRELIVSAGPWDESLHLNQDGEFFCRVLLKSQAIRHCSSSKVFYRSGLADSISRDINYNKITSLLKSYQLYVSNLQEHLTSSKVRHALMVNFLNFIYQHYDDNLALVEEAKQNIKSLGFDQLELVGGKRFMKISSLIGFERALKLRKTFRKII